MKFFIDTADVKEIRDLSTTGLLDGVTTNPSLIKKSGRKITELIEEICKIVSGPVSAEVAATTFDKMIKEAQVLKKIADNVTIKLPLTWDGLMACKALRDEGIMVNITLCFSASQALLAAKSGANFISPFVGRLDDIGADGMSLISEIKQIYSNYNNLTTEILVASVRHPRHVIEAAKLGADVVTLPPNVIKQLITHPLTDKGLDAFLKDWKETGQEIG
ncbi:MAG: Transaldolase [Alphaproteobacteria bacterium MarineAlpha9_Bin1]|nr:MAG: Transaldolase [Alphaproteobacteria bacterium MarineAlpha9_Bin1]